LGTHQGGGGKKKARCSDLDEKNEFFLEKKKKKGGTRPIRKKNKKKKHENSGFGTPGVNKATVKGFAKGGLEHEVLLAVYSEKKRKKGIDRNSLSRRKEACNSVPRKNT